ncbi:CAP domain-containing protein [Fibrobacter sp. UWB11]|uniref:CAP domain-containing protein n=1 Tax=Fibrobacter sp. UWB11 TaxID=1896202 RepID=UPI0009419F44|nr:CAP domain-containing protein [Fibrobacter sp. UWB11]
MKVNLFMKTAGFAICASLAFAFTACSDNVSVVKYESHEVEKQPSPSEVIKSSSSAKSKASSSSKKSESSSSVAQSSSAKTSSSSVAKPSSSSSAKASSSSSEKKSESSSSEKKPASSSSETPKSSATSSSSAGTSFFSENWRQACLDKINEYRATENLEPLTLAPEEKQTCTDKQAGDDLAENKAHGHFGACGEGAQNSGPNFNTSWRKTAIEVSDAYLKMMWEDEKALVTSGERDPNKDEDYSYIGHYLNMKGNYKTVACGITLSEDGKKGWFNVNFFRK